MSFFDKPRSAHAMATEYSTFPPSSEKASDKSELRKSYDEKHVEDKSERENSPIYNIRTITNWIKSCVIQAHTRPGARVLDLGCGHGTDLLKYAANNIGLYVGVDISSELLAEAIQRYNHIPGMNFTAKFICSDFAEHTIHRPDILDNGVVFDLVSSQLALQYVWSGERQVRTFFRNVTDRLVSGGYAIGCYPDPVRIMNKLAASRDHKTIQIGDICSIKFRDSLEELQTMGPYGIVYEVTLGEVMDSVPEYLVSTPILEKMVEEYGLETIYQMNFQDYFQIMKGVPPYSDLLKTHNAPAERVDFLHMEWELLSLYTVFVFQKKFSTNSSRNSVMQETDIIHIP